MPREKRPFVSRIVRARSHVRRRSAGTFSRHAQVGDVSRPPGSELQAREEQQLLDDLFGSADVLEHAAGSDVLPGIGNGRVRLLLELVALSIAPAHRVHARRVR